MDSVHYQPAVEPLSPLSEELAGEPGKSLRLFPLTAALLSVQQAENSALSLENDNQRRQYEHCLDEVSAHTDAHAHTHTHTHTCVRERILTPHTRA